MKTLRVKDTQDVSQFSSFFPIDAGKAINMKYVFSGYQVAKEYFLGKYFAPPTARIPTVNVI